MSLPTNTWISVDRSNEIPESDLRKGYSIPVDLTDLFMRRFDCTYHFLSKTWIQDLYYTPTHFMIIELPK